MLCAIDCRCDDVNDIDDHVNDIDDDINDINDDINDVMMMLILTVCCEGDCVSSGVGGARWTCVDLERRSFL